jgi:amidohydrolase
MPADPLRDSVLAELKPLVRLRHELHQNPELSFQEHATSQIVQRELAAIGIEFKKNLARGTGVVGYLPASDPSDRTKPAVALRADIDALPITESTGKAYASCTPGVMHACGHDGHTTMLIGAARVLTKSKRPNPVTFIFQPAEEDGGGAEHLCNEGALKGAGGGPAGIGNAVARIYGLHGWPTMPLGQIGTRPGAMLASTDEFEVTVQGVGGHAAYPHLCKDPIVAASHIIVALQTLVSRNVGPLDSAVATVGIIRAGTANNIIPDSAYFIGTFRALSEATRRLGEQRIMELIRATAQAHGCRADAKWLPGYPVTNNDPAEAKRVLTLAADRFGAQHAIQIEHPTMGGEDFAYYCKHVPACFFFLGMKPSGMDRYPALHQPDFDFNDEVIPTGVEMLAAAALSS